MHICVLTNRPPADDPVARVTIGVLERAGNSVTEVRVVSPSASLPAPGVVAVPSRRPRGGGKVGALIRRLQPAAWRQSDLHRRTVAAAAATGADLYLPIPTNLLPAAADAARQVDGAVMRTPAQPDAGDVDLIRLAPKRPDLAEPPAGMGSFHTPSDDRSYRPEPGRHAGRKVVMAYRKTDSNPGKYLEEALRLSGVDVRLETDRVDFDTVDPDTDFVLFVEGPYPAIDVRGETPSCPVLFWFHHGEHHLHANLRLVDRYRADAVLMAHSWHLAHWVPAPVHRFPFGIPTELISGKKSLSERRYDVAMVGAKLWEGGPYTRRQQIVADLEAAFPLERLGFAEKVTAAEMAALYEEARIIPNEGGTRHYPITMRVFEAVAARAVLLTDDLPGTDMLFDPGRHYLVLEDDVVSQAKSILSDLDRAQEIADAAHARALGRHTYQHRVDELFEIAARSQKRRLPDRPQRSPLASVIDRDAEVVRVAQVGAPELVDELSDRQVFDALSLDSSKLAPGKMETVALRSDDVGPYLDLLRAARRYIYLDGAAAGLDQYLAAEQPQALVSRHEGVTRVDLVAESYRVMPHEIVDDARQT